MSTRVYIICKDYEAIRLGDLVMWNYILTVIAVSQWCRLTELHWLIVERINRAVL